MAARSVRDSRSFQHVIGIEPRNMAASPESRALAGRVRQGDRAELARAITLVGIEEAGAPSHARGPLGQLLPHTGKAVRVGITACRAWQVDGDRTRGSISPARATRGRGSRSSTFVKRTAARSSATRRAWRGWPWTSAPSCAPRRPRARSAASPRGRAKPCSCARPRATTWCWSRPWAPVSRRPRWRR